jgi:sodium-dependent dicarboxylate transporter 2/3/5
MTEATAVAAQPATFDWKKWTALLGGLAVFLLVYFSAPWSDAVDPGGKVFSLSAEGKAAIGLFLMARADAYAVRSRR